MSIVFAAIQMAEGRKDVCKSPQQKFNPISFFFQIAKRESFSLMSVTQATDVPRNLKHKEAIKGQL